MKEINGIRLLGHRYEVRYNKVGNKLENSKILFASNYVEADDNTKSNKEEEKAKKIMKEVIGKVKTSPISVAVKAPRDIYSELFICKVIGQMESYGFRACAFYTQKREFVPYRVIKNYLSKGKTVEDDFSL